MLLLLSFLLPALLISTYLFSPCPWVANIFWWLPLMYYRGTLCHDGETPSFILGVARIATMHACCDWETWPFCGCCSCVTREVQLFVNVSAVHCLCSLPLLAGVMCEKDEGRIATSWLSLGHWPLWLMIRQAYIKCCVYYLAIKMFWSIYILQWTWAKTNVETC